MKTINSYGIGGAVSLAIDYVRTRIGYKYARLIRFPIYVRGWRWISIDKKLSVGRCLRLEAFSSSSIHITLIKIGSNVRINDYVHIGAIKSVTIGNNVLIASKVYISDHNHGCYGFENNHSDPRIPPNERQLSSSPVIIEDDVWIGESVAVLPGVSIGKGSIIGALSTVTRDIPPYSIAVGSPASVIKRYDFSISEWVSV